MLGTLDPDIGSAILWQDCPKTTFLSQEVHYKNENQDHKIPELSIVIKDVGGKRNQLECKNAI